MPDDVAQYLADALIAVPGDDLVYGRVPEAPDAIVVVNGTGGRAAQSTHDGHEIRYPRVQIIVRDPVSADAWARAQTIRDLLNAVKSLTVPPEINGRTYQAIVPLSEVFAMTGDTSGRTLLGCNYECWWAV